MAEDGGVEPAGAFWSSCLSWAGERAVRVRDMSTPSCCSCILTLACSAKLKSVLAGTRLDVPLGERSTK